jgi:hypothetical protein
MIQSPPPALAPEELQLARLLWGRLVPRLQGLLSVGLAFAHADGPGALSFLRERFPDIEAHARVLRSIRGSPEAAARAEAMTQALRRLGEEFNAEDLFEGDRRPTLRRLRASFTLVCDALAEYADLIGTDASPVERMKAVCLPVFDYLEHTPLLAEEEVPCTSSTPTST